VVLVDRASTLISGDTLYLKRLQERGMERIDQRIHGYSKNLNFFATDEKLSACSKRKCVLTYVL
jgi:hypothetical protein